MPDNRYAIKQIVWKRWKNNSNRYFSINIYSSWCIFNEGNILLRDWD